MSSSSWLPVCSVVLLSLTACEKSGDAAGEPSGVDITAAAAIVAEGRMPTGDWTPDTYYEPNSLISHDGQVFLSILASDSIEPGTSTEHWVLTPLNSVSDSDSTDTTILAAASQPVMIWRGPWIDGEQYGLGDVVARLGQAYIATSDSLDDVTPEDSVFWDLLASRGAPGPAGIQGNQGPQGVIGAEGVKGDTGDAGPVGATGPKGDTGDAGPVGATGRKGDTGDAGPVGATGLKGDTGDAGPAGSTGPKGDTGDAGLAGATGPKGDTGDAGPAGSTGPKGDTGDAGPAGLTWEGPWSAIGSYDVGDGVSHNGSSYIAIQTTPAGTAPNDTTYWDTLAQAGTNGSSSGSGSSEVRFVIAGTTSSLFAGNAGYRAINAACETDFGAGARMATSLDLLKNPPAVAPTSNSFIQGIAHPSDVAIDNISGVSPGGGPSNLTCNSWTSTSGNGLVVNGSTLSFNQWAACANSTAALCAMPDGTESSYEFAGFSTATMTGSAGYFGMVDACRDTYGAEARLATSEEVAESSLDVNQSGVAWVQGIAHPSDPAIDTITGISTGTNLTCTGWSNSGSNLGLTVNGSTYSMATQFCYQSAAIACSIPK